MFLMMRVIFYLSVKLAAESGQQKSRREHDDVGASSDDGDGNGDGDYYE